MDRENLNLLIKNVRLIDPGQGIDTASTDLLIIDGALRATEPQSPLHNIPVLDLGGRSVVAMPPGIDLHVHFRSPGNSEAEDVISGSAAAAAGGFGHVVMMANTSPVIDNAEAVAHQREKGKDVAVTVDTVCALTLNLEGQELVDVAACAGAGAVAFTDDGRNLATEEIALSGLAKAAAENKAVLVHAEDEAMISAAGFRTSEAEESAIAKWISWLERVPDARLHIQHISTAWGLHLVEVAKEKGLAITCEVTPHHLALTQPSTPTTLDKVNPPLRTEADVEALRQGLRDGLIDAIATDHAPHLAAGKALLYAGAPAGMIGLELAWPLLLQAGFSGPSLAIAVRGLTVGPAQILGIEVPTLKGGERTSLVLMDVNEGWTVDETTLLSRSQNTPLYGHQVEGKVLLTVLNGQVIHSEQAMREAANV